MTSPRVWSLIVLALVSVPTPAKAEVEAKAPALRDYQKVKAASGHTPEANVRLALWCEEHGLKAERLRHLAMAVLADPSNVKARGLMGLVAAGGKWVRPEKVADAGEVDAARAPRLAEYNRRRAELDDQPERNPRERQTLARLHARLGLWCEQNGLDAEANAHFTSAVVLDPYHDASWKHLGYVRHEGRWVSAAQLATDRQEADAQRQADRAWEPRLRTWRGWLADDSRQDEALRRLAEVDDPRAVPAIGRVFAGKGAGDQLQAVAMLARIDSRGSTTRLAELAVVSPHGQVRGAATRALKEREPREYAGRLVDMIRSPMKYRVQPVGGPGSPGALLVETPRFKMLRTYEAPPIVELSNQFYGYVGYDANGLPVVARGIELRSMSRSPAKAEAEIAMIEARTAMLIGTANLKAIDSQQRLIADVQAIEASNAQAAQANSLVIPVLAETLDAPSDLKDDETAWQTWWYDRLGYRYDPPQQQTLAMNVSPQLPPPRIYSCFVAGTPVRTLKGLRPIESLVAGDQVLSQDTATGELSFQSVKVVHHNAPNATLRVELGNGEILAPSVYHRFWRAGKGWSLARDLKPGDVLRTLEGLTSVVSVSAGPVAPLYNLDVAKTRTFFVGAHSALVHDNTLPEIRQKPFDEPARLASAR